jgi:lipid A 4'-phosphatase
MDNVAKKAFAALRWPAVWAPALVLAAATLAFRWNGGAADLALVRPFYSAEAAGSDTDACWPLKFAQPWKSLYDWGEYPALLLGCGGLVVWIVSFWWTRIDRWRDPGLFLALVLIIGPGIIVNGLIKPCWARPRPNGTVPFDGPSQFVPVWQLGQGKDDWSFPSGHAAMGFYLMAPAFFCSRRRPALAAGFLLFGLASGTVMGLARVVAGCHFPSDVLWSGGIVYFTALLLAAPFRFGRVGGAQSSVVSSQSSVVGLRGEKPELTTEH